MLLNFNGTRTAIASCRNRRNMHNLRLSSWMATLREVIQSYPSPAHCQGPVEVPWGFLYSSWGVRTVGRAETRALAIRAREKGMLANQREQSPTSRPSCGSAAGDGVARAAGQ